MIRVYITGTEATIDIPDGSIPNQQTVDLVKDILRQAQEQIKTPLRMREHAEGEDE